MRPSSYKALLIIADISGFTQFLKQHATAANQAMQIVVELLRAVIAAAAPPLRLVEVEGDAAFFYALCPEGGDLTREMASVKNQVKSFFHSFQQTLQRLCGLYPHVHGAKNLRLKVIIHAGEVALEHIHGFDKLFGMDVILAHRLLKNSVPSPEYVLLTEAAYNRLGDFFQTRPDRQAQYCDGIGVVETLVFYPPAPPKPCLNLGKKSFEKSPARAGICLTAFDIFNLASSPFGNMPNNDLLAEPFYPCARAQPIAAALTKVQQGHLQTKIKWRLQHEVYVTDLLRRTNIG